MDAVAFEVEERHTVIEIDNKKYNVSTILLMGKKTVTLSARLMKKATPFLRLIKNVTNSSGGSIFAGGKVDFSKINLPDSFIDDLVDILLTGLDEKDMLSLILDLVKTTTVNENNLQNESVFDLVFQGNLMLLFQVVKFVIVENFGSFFKTGNFGIVANLNTVQSSRKT